MTLVAGEGRGSEGIHKVEGRAFAYYSRAEAKHVGVVVLTGKTRRELVGAAGRPYAPHLVGRIGHPQAGAADKYAHIALPARDLLTNRHGDVGIVAPLAGSAAHVYYFVSFFFQMRLYRQFKLRGGVIVSYCYLHFHFLRFI